MLKIENLSLDFLRYEDRFFKKEPVRIISNLNLHIKPGEIVAVVGSSGAGKSLLAHSILGILPKNARLSGTVEFKNEPLTEIRKKRLRGKEIALIPQSVNFLNPLKTAGRQVYRSAYLSIGNREKAIQSKNAAFERYSLSDDVKNRYPFQISGGMARRVLTAIATVTDADLIIGDEPTTGLDHDAIDESLSFLRSLADSGKGVMLITHDVKYALKYADTIAVFYGGTTVEIARPSDFNDPSTLRHPYTREIHASLPQNDFSHIAGLNPFGSMLTSGCVFEPRCKHRTIQCSDHDPEYRKVNNGQVRCHHA